jgi:MFS family permease
LIAPAVAWLATVFGLRRVLGIPSLVYALISLVIPFVHDYPTLIALSIVHGMLLGTFVPATLMIIFAICRSNGGCRRSRSIRSGSGSRSTPLPGWSVSMSTIWDGSGCIGRAW